jgi:hypothetical protein
VIKTAFHVFCSEDCLKILEHNPNFDCFHDGCSFECCACGSCSNQAECPETGQGLTWHP